LLLRLHQLSTVMVISTTSSRPLTGVMLSLLAPKVSASHPLICQMILAAPAERLQLTLTTTRITQTLK